MFQKHPMQESEWYKRSRFDPNPDQLREQFLHSHGEFSANYDITFEKHLERLKKK